MTDVEVFLDREGEPERVGTAHFTRGPGRVTTTFQYSPEYLRRPGAPPIDPAFPLHSGNQYVDRLAGAFGDSAPDRWGRNLLQRREQAAARDDHRAPRSLDDVDFLLGVNDETRQGALRFRTAGTEGFEGADARIPRVADLPKLMRASESVGADDESSDAVKVLLAAGTASLGGARPKASIRLDDGRLAIAKFPHSTDEWDVEAWEAIALEIAGRAGIRVPDVQRVPLGDRAALLLARFDRGAGSRRIGYMSAMTLLQRRDGDGSDYVEVMEALPDVSANARADRAELFSRVVLNVALRSTDDHLRNHGLLLGHGGWRLSPAFDVNPHPDPGAPRITGIAGAVAPDEEWDGIMALAEAGRISSRDAVDRVDRLTQSASGWREVAARHGVTRPGQERFAESLESGVSVLRRGADRLRAAGSPTRATRAKTTPRSTRGSFARRDEAGTP